MDQTMSGAMTVADLHGIFVSNRGLIAETWNFFVTVHMAIIGLMFVARGNAVPLVARLLVLVGYAAFMYINYRAQVDNYGYSTEVLRRLQALEGEKALVSMFQIGWINSYLPVIYIGAGVFSIVVVLTTYYFRDEKANRQAGIGQAA